MMLLDSLWPVQMAGNLLLSLTGQQQGECLQQKELALAAGMQTCQSWSYGCDNVASCCAA